jgi:hypothetical protein
LSCPLASWTQRHLIALVLLLLLLLLLLSLTVSPHT